AQTGRRKPRARQGAASIEARRNVSAELTTPSAPILERIHFVRGVATPPLRGGEYALQHLLLSLQPLLCSMAIIVLAVHDVRAPRKEADILGYLFKLLRLRIDDDDRVLGRIGQIDFLILGVGRCRLELDVQADPDASGRSETVHIVNVNEAAG